MTGPTLEAVGLTKRYGAFTALDDLNLRLEGSKCVGFLGPNGAGKTTTFKLFADMIRPTSGRAYINGIDVARDKIRALSSCGVLIETPEIYPSLTPKDALSLIGELRNIPNAEINARIAEVLETVKMGEWIDKRVEKFSRGMKQRINIAAALLGDPEILVLDEPSNGLDPKGMSDVREILKSLKQKMKLIMISSHLLNDVSEICDEVALIDRGKLVKYGTLEDVVSAAAESADVIEVTLARPFDERLVTVDIPSISGVRFSERLGPRSIRIKFEGGVNGQENLLSELAAMKIGLISSRVASSSLEEAYAKIIKSEV